MKAVITLTADASGVQAGVTRAMAQLQRLQTAAMDIRNVVLGGMLGNALQSLFGNALSEFNRLKELGSTFSAEGMGAAAGLQIQQMRSDMALGQAFGPFAALVDQIKAQGLIELTNYLVENKAAIGEAIVNIAIFGKAIATVTADLLVMTSNVINAAANLLQGNLSTAMSNLAAADVFGLGDSAFMQGGAAFGETLMQYTPAGQILQLLERKLGGN
jgi:hypothetical protein